MTFFCLPANAHPHTHIHTHPPTHIHTHTHTHAHTRPHTDAHTHTQTRTYTHTDMHTHAHMQRLKKWYLIPPCLTLSNIRYVSRVKWSNPGKGVAPFPTPQCSSYWKGSLKKICINVHYRATLEQRRIFNIGMTTAHMHTHAHTHIHTRTRTHTHAHIHTHTYAHTYTHKRARTHTHTHTYTHIHTKCGNLMKHGRVSELGVSVS